MISGTRKILFSIALILILLAGSAWAGQVLPALGGTTGGGTGALDAIYAGGDAPKYSALATGDICIVSDPSTRLTSFYMFYIDDDAQSESAPFVILPDEQSPGVAYSGNGAWLMMSLSQEQVSTPKKEDTAGELFLYEADGTGTDNIGLLGPSSMGDDTSYRGEFSGAGPVAAGAIQMWAASSSGTGAPDDPLVHLLSWAYLDDTAGDGDTGSLWSTDRILQEFASIRATIGVNAPDVLAKMTDAVDGGIAITTASGTALLNDMAVTYNTSTNTLSVENITYTGDLTGPAVADPEWVLNSLASTDWTGWGDDSVSEFILAYGAVPTMAAKWNTTGVMTLLNGETLDNSTDGRIKTSGDFEITGDDLFMGTNTDAYMLIADGTNFNPVAISGDVTITNAGAVTIANDAVTMAKLDDDGNFTDWTGNWTFAGTVTANGAASIGDGGDKIQIYLDPTPGTDADANGVLIMVTTSTGVNAVAGDLVVVVNTGGTTGPIVALADADLSTKVGAVFLITETINATNSGKALVSGVMRLDSWNWSGANKALFISTTAGDMTETIPSVAGQYVQKIGYSLTPDIILFRPSVDFAEVQ